MKKQDNLKVKLQTLFWNVCFTYKFKKNIFVAIMFWLGQEWQRVVKFA